MWELVEWTVWEDYTEEETVGQYATEADALAAADTMTAALSAEVMAAYGEDWGFTVRMVEG